MSVIDRTFLDFILFEWLDVAALARHQRFSGQSAGDYAATLDLAEKLAVNEFLPAFRAGDRNEPHLDRNGRVVVDPAVAQAVGAYLESGLQLASVDAAHGGMQMPMAVASGAMANVMAANIAASGFIMLSIANARVISDFGTTGQVEFFARPQFEGQALGTMCLSEPDVGSSLGDITTRAVADGEDGIGRRYRLKGSKMWISGGDQNIVDNTVHLVLAKIAGSDGRLLPGSKGISLFAVPLELPEAAGGGANDVAVAGLNHKMGYRGIPNCLLNFGERGDGAVGWLIGEPGQGMPIMFQMMNEARINVGLGAAALAWRGYALSRAYADERRQGRPLENRQAASPVPIIGHPDVRRMMLAQRSIAEGALALTLYCARLADLHAHADDAEERARSGTLLDILTPVAKSWPSEMGLVANSLAIQVHGGYGYTRDFEVEQLYRDNRLNPIHEGTTGIQAIDLLGRKILFDGLRSFDRLMDEMRATIRHAETGGQLTACAGALSDRIARIETFVRREAEAADAPASLRHATPFLQAFGHLVVAWIWLDTARAALGRESGDPLRRRQLAACRYFYEYEVPLIDAWLAPLMARSELLAEEEVIF